LEKLAKWEKGKLVAGVVVVVAAAAAAA